MPATAPNPLPSLDILGVPISRVTRTSALAVVRGWIDAGAGAYVCTCDVHSLMTARTNPEHCAALKGASMVTPDGQPLAWTARLRGYSDIERVCGPDLMPVVCKTFAPVTRHYFLGGAAGVSDALVERMQAAAPGLQVVGSESPPYRALSDAELEAMLQRIRSSGANVVWIGLGCPKQELWMHANHHRLPGVILFGVGAAFDFHTDRVARAPLWMRNAGLEWLHRLVSEPRRLWRRYLVLAPRFVIASALETAGFYLRRSASRP